MTHHPHQFPIRSGIHTGSDRPGRQRSPRTIDAASPRPVPNWPGYFADHQGVIWSEKSGSMAPLAQTKDAQGRLWVTLSRPGRTQNFRVHRVVLEAFCGPRPKGQLCRHLNGKPHDNRLKNICWGTPKENFEDDVRNGVLRKGFPRHTEGGYSVDQSVVSPSDVVEMRDMYAKGVMIKDLVTAFGLSRRAVFRAIKGESWRFLPMPDYSNRPENRGRHMKQKRTSR